MTRTVLALALLGVVCLLALPAAPPTEATTELSGPILANTLLSHTASPYHVTGPVAVAPGVTLTIEPGVTLTFAAGANLTIYGTLVAEGTTAEHITFRADDPNPAVFWGGILVLSASKTGGAASLGFADISRATTGLLLNCCPDTDPHPVHVRDSTFSDNVNGILGFASAGSTIERTTFTRNDAALRWAIFNDTPDLTLVESQFVDNRMGVSASAGVSIFSSTFSGNVTAVNGCRCTLIGNTFHDNGTAIDAPIEAMSITYNLITANQTGVIARYELLFPVSGSQSVGAFDHNNIVANAQQNLQLVSDLNHAIPDNWWGTTNTATIDVGILDGHDQSGLGLLDYQPILTGPVDISSQLPPAFTPTATSTRTPTPTATPTQAPATVTPISTLAPPGSIACVPRPRVDVSTVSDGPGRLRVTITAQSSAGAPSASPNRLARLTIAASNNAVVESGQPLVQIASPMVLASRALSTTFWVRRLDPTLATTVHLLIDDDCGQWPTFVGGGPGAF